MAVDILATHTVKLSLPPNFVENYNSDAYFGPIYRALHSDLPTKAFERDCIRRLLPLFSLHKETLVCEDKLSVPRANMREILHLAHHNKLYGHLSSTKTLSRLDDFHWRHKGRDVELYYSGCILCQQYKDRWSNLLGVPQPLEQPSHRWGKVSMDFVTQLPKTKWGFDAIKTFVDRLPKRVHFAPSFTTNYAPDGGRCFFNMIFRLLGLPDLLMSDRVPKFKAKFWNTLMHLWGIHPKMSTNHHRQTDGSSEMMNRMVANYLRCFVAQNQEDWDQFLSSAELTYNSA